MNLHRLTGPPPPDLARALAAFEERFTYPLGPGRSFRISHGDDYPRFFRAIGDAVCFIAERQGRVLGSLAVAVRPLHLPGGGERPAAYLADLKIDPEVRGGIVLRRLAREADALARLAGAAFSVVMEGTKVTPLAYTGRVGIPAFAELGRIAVLRLPCRTDFQSVPAEEDGLKIRPTEARDCYLRLSRGRYASPGGKPAERSGTAPFWLLSPDGSAVGLFEDTRRAKRLFADDGSELNSAHLSSFAFRTAPAGAALLRSALGHAARLGFPALFVAVAAEEAPALVDELAMPDVVVAPALVYGAGLEPGFPWNVNTSEI
jgi:hypothetical protein